MRQLNEAELTAFELRKLANNLNLQADILESVYGVTQEIKPEVNFAFDPRKKRRK